MLHRLWFALAAAALAQAQTVHSTLTGRVLDPSGAVIPEAKVTAAQALNNLTLTTTASATGDYTFALLPPGRYTVTAKHAGFATVSISNVVLDVGARTALDIELKVDSTGASVTVSADAATLQLKTESGERSDIITNRQIRDLALNGRNILDLMKVIPGVVSNVSGQVSNDGGVRNFNINGARGTQKEISIDGSSNVISGANQRVHVTLNPDAIQEVKILTSNYQAEFGKTAGGFIQYTTRSGTAQFHGGVRYFRRHDSLNANNFFSNARGFPRQIYRYNYSGYDIGGPVLLPGTRFNRNRDKLFFFWNQEFYRQVIPGGARTLRMPTEAERRGDFSQTTDGNGNLVLIRDPNTGLPCTAANRAGCFAGNVVPASRIFRDGQSILGILPLPNDTAGGARYNHSSQFSNRTPRREDIIRVDYNISSRTRLAARYIQNTERTVQRYGGCNNIAYAFPLADLTSTQAPQNASFNLVHSFTPTLINELTVAPSRSRTSCVTSSDRFLRGTYGLTFPLPFGNLPGSEVIPSFQFGGIANQAMPTADVGVLPRYSGDANLTITNNLSKFLGKHSFKTGFFFQRNRFFFTGRSTVSGDINFNNDANNPLNTGHPFSNALLGVYSQFAQANAQPEGRPRYYTTEGFLQDTWKVSRRLTLDLGLRISYMGPAGDENINNNIFRPDTWDRTKAPRLYHPVLVAGAQRAVDPANRPAALTAANTLPAAFVGLLVPGSGDPLNGVTRVRDGYPRGGFDARGPQWGPRLGFAYSPFGSRTVIRGGFGISYERVQGNVLLAQVNTPPTLLTPRLFYGRLAELGGGSGALAPTNHVGYPREGKVPNIYSQSIGVQHQLGGGAILDVSYVGTLSRHLVQQRNLNAVPYFTTFSAAAQDPTRTGGTVPAEEPGLPAVYRAAGHRFSGQNALPLNFLRPFPGFAELNYREFSGSSNYHSLQVALNRRFAGSLGIELAYTWSRAMSVSDIDFEGVHPYNTRAYDYSVAEFDRTHTLVANYIYEIPAPKRMRLLLGGWQASGVSQFYTGEPFELGLGIQGVNAAQRIVGSYNLPVRPLRRGGAAGKANGLEINPDAYVVPAIGDLGPYPRTYLRNPWFINHDLAIFKNIPLGADSVRKLQLRVEMFNFLNSTQFNGINAATQLVGPRGELGTRVFDVGASELKITNNLRPAGSAAPMGQFFGEFSSARDPRIIQFAAKIYF
ncbi:MAG: hypothetical protein FJW40_21465 [Acidobacteria bacterium]|nr:hypothetical protein [Acidobacteriota bacterium]